jgi:PEP-CTERM motif
VDAVSRIAIAAAASLALLAGASHAVAATIVDDFTFYSGAGDTGTKLATGSFSYDSSNSGTLSYADLESFSVTVLGQSSNLSFVDGLTSSSDYVYFGYNTLSNTFVPAVVTGFAGPTGGILAATDGVSGFFFDPLATQSFANNDGELEAYSTGNIQTAESFSISAAPEPATWGLMIIGVGMAGGALRAARKSRRIALVHAA